MVVKANGTTFEFFMPIHIRVSILEVVSSYHVGYPSVGRNPVDLPCLAFVGGKCLLESA
jgi:hypothetical protein